MRCTIYLCFFVFFIDGCIKPKQSERLNSEFTVGLVEAGIREFELDSTTSFRVSYLDIFETDD